MTKDGFLYSAPVCIFEIIISDTNWSQANIVLRKKVEALVSNTGRNEGRDRIFCLYNS